MGTRRWSKRRFRLYVGATSFLVAVGLAEVLLGVFFPLTWKVHGPNGALLEWQPSRPYICRVTTVVWETDFAEQATPQAIADWDSGEPTIDHQGTRFFRHPVRGWDCDSGVRGRPAAASFSSLTTTKILAVGDSFTFGSDVRPYEAWCNVLERSIPGAEVFNCGVPGYGVDQIALKLEEYGPRLKPPIVLWGLVNDDLLRAGRAWFPKSWMPKPQVVIAGDTWTVTPPRTRAEVFEEASGWTSRVGLCARAGLDLLRYGSWKRDCVELFRGLMRISKARVESWGGRLIVVYLPTGGPILRNDDTDGERYMDICRELGLEVVDVRELVRAKGLSEEQIEGFTLKANGRGHYTPAGNAHVAEVVQEHLLRMKQP